ncbi:hypothetical protein NQ317_017210 [Molorchus minor]|uniref:Macro domain-containing protein n=1 Tax=Molorchus minor TaxID=1323400 RepID=A0ABQ9JWK3_9CUCU|nr:hypothetical protein NQ317_017210 [Molorchus minor]
MEPNDLKAPELIFELRSRGVEPKDNQMLRRAQFRGILAKEKEVDGLREARHVSTDELYASAIDLFTGPALLWYKNIKKSIHSWSELVECLKRDFLPVDYEEDLLNEIKSRTQGPSENVLFYIIAVESMYNRLTNPYSEKEKVKQIKQRYRPPPSRKLQLLEPDLACMSLNDRQSVSFSELQSEDIPSFYVSKMRFKKLAKRCRAPNHFKNISKDFKRGNGTAEYSNVKINTETRPGPGGQKLRVQEGQFTKQEKLIAPSGQVHALSLPSDNSHTLRFHEKYCDLFTVSSDYSLVHCVSADFRMSRGIAYLFKQKFGGIEYLRGQNQSRGGLAILKDGLRNIYYLVTKDRSYHKPEYEDLWQSLVKLKQHVDQSGIKKLAMPTIGCGLDRLSWPKVKKMLLSCFQKTNIEILICHVPVNDSVAGLSEEIPQLNGPTLYIRLERRSRGSIAVLYCLV